MAFVMKVEFEGILRRLLYNSDGEENLSFAKLEGRVRDLLKLPGTAQLKVTYKDKEDDDVTLTNDQELEDACLIQKLNPLRLQVALLPPPPRTDESDTFTAETAGGERSSAEEPQSVENPMSVETYVKKVVESYVPVLERRFPPSKIAEVKDDIVKQVTAQVSDPSPETSRLAPTDWLRSLRKTTESVAPSSETCRLAPVDWLRSLPKTTESVTPSAETSRLAPADWLRSLPPPSSPFELEKQNKNTPETPAEAAVETSSVNASAESEKEVAHNGVTCNMCNMRPITGVFYNGILRTKYDRCGHCSDKSGRAAEDNRIERPLSGNSVKMVRISPGMAEGRGNSRTRSNQFAKIIVAASGGGSKPMKC